MAPAGGITWFQGRYLLNWASQVALVGTCRQSLENSLINIPVNRDLKSEMMIDKEKNMDKNNNFNIIK